MEREKKAPVITVHISWGGLKVRRRGNYLDILLFFFLIQQIQTEANYMPSTGRCRKDSGHIRM